jgi:hypothetical protein
MGEIAVIASTSFVADHSAPALIQVLETERDGLKAAVRAELEAVRRGEGSMYVADDLSQRLNAVESRMLEFILGFLSIA